MVLGLSALFRGLKVCGASATLCQLATGRHNRAPTPELLASGGVMNPLFILRSSAGNLGWRWRVASRVCVIVRPERNDAGKASRHRCLQQIAEGGRHHAVFGARVVAPAVNKGTTTHLEDLVVVPSRILVVSEWNSDRIGMDRSHPACGSCSRWTAGVEQASSSSRSWGRIRSVYGADRIFSERIASQRVLGSILSPMGLRPQRKPQQWLVH